MIPRSELDDEFDPLDDIPSNPQEAAVQIQRSLTWLEQVCSRHGLDSVAAQIRTAGEEARRQAFTPRIVN